MSNFRMRSFNSAIKLAVENNSPADARAYGHIDEPRAIASCAPSGFRQGGGIPVIFQSDAQVESLRQVAHRTLPAPPGQEIHIAKLAAHGVYRACRSDANPSQFDAGARRCLA